MTDPIDTFLAGYSPHVQIISRTLRAMVKSAMPQANEILFAFRTWSPVTYFFMNQKECITENKFFASHHR
jgi:hypothetical protein